MSIALDTINQAITDFIAGDRVSEVTIKGVTTKFENVTLSQLENIRKRIIAEDNQANKKRRIRTRSMIGGKGL